jgi:prepilin-type N-terminal cleavage/methylation domain-containing protein
MKSTISKKNEGYSLIEMIIVIAIIAIVAGMSMLSIFIVHSARAKDSAITLDSEIAELRTKSKNMTPVDPTGADPDYGKTHQFAIGLYKNNAKGKVRLVHLHYDTKNKKYVTPGKDNIYTASDDIEFSSRVKVTFDGITYGQNEQVPTIYGSLDSHTGVVTSIEAELGSYQTNFVFIRFDKKGNCISGFGKYKFYRKNGNVVSTTTLKQNGSHQVR